MGLISKSAIMKWNPANRSWYEDKDYVFTKWKDEFIINIQDLPHASESKVYVKCDCKNCKNPILKPMFWSNYLKNVNIDGTYYCKACAIKMSNIKLLKQGLKKSFYDWCLEHNRFDILLRWDFELNGCSPGDITYSTHTKYWFKCNRGIHPSELKHISDFTSGHDGSIQCKACNSIGQYIVDTYGTLIGYWSYIKNIDKNGNKLNPFTISKSSNKKVWVKCKEISYHDSYLISASKIVQGIGCPYCHGEKTHLYDSLGWLHPEILNLWSKKNEKSPFKYKPYSAKKVWFECLDEKHEDYKTRINDAMKCNFRCPSCVRERTESILQEKVRLYLEALCLGQILHEYKCTIIPKNPKNNAYMPFDNEIQGLNFLIETMGQQHYKICKFHYMSAKRNHTTPEYEFHMQKIRDRYKKFIAHKMGYKYIAIPYWTDNDNKEWRTLIENKLNNII